MSTQLLDNTPSPKDELAKLQQRVIELEAQSIERDRTDRVLRTIVEGTASATSSNFLELLVHKLAAALEVRYALITELADPKPIKQATKVRTLALWLGQGLGDNFEYGLAGTPCGVVIADNICSFHPINVQALFPEDQDLVMLEAESYIGIPLLDSLGNIMGHLAALDDKPMENREYLESIMRIFTARAAAEMERKQADEALRASTEQLERTLDNLKQTQLHLVQSEKMSALGQLVAGVAHEINNPVNFIHGNLVPAQKYIRDLLNLLQLYQAHFPQATPEIQQEIEAMDLEFLQKDLVQLLTSMQVGTERISGIVRSLRLFSRLDEAEMKAVNIHEGIDSTLMLLESRLKATEEKAAISIIKEYGDFPLVECYAGELNQVFMNILVNAIDSLESRFANDSLESGYGDDSRKELSELAGDQTTPTITIRTGTLDHDRLFISIADNGIGMDQNVQNQLFNPFFTTKPVGKGTGLGVSIGYQIVTEKHRGTLSCKSSPGMGAEFTIEIPQRQLGKNQGLVEI